MTRGRRTERPVVDPAIQARAEAIERALRDIGGDHSEFDQDRYLLPGLPRIRPLLVLLCAQAARTSEEPALHSSDDDREHVAMAAEMLHWAVLVHDMALGHTGGKRRRVAKKLLGGAVGWLGGNALIVRALELAQTSTSVEVVHDLVDALREVAEGQAVSSTWTEDTPPSPEDWLRVAEAEMGAVFAFSCRAGARVGGAPRPVVTGLGRYGRHAGLAWRMASDLQPFRDQSAPTPAQWATNVPYPVALAIQADPAVGESWASWRKTRSGAATRRLRQEVSDTGSVRLAHERLVGESWAARRALAAVPPSSARLTLDAIAQSVAL